jgi:hypothetical protein
MRVLCSSLDGSALEGEVIGGEFCDEVSGEVDLAETFTVRTDEGAAFSVHGWLVDVVILESGNLRVM